jgi:hypothetical protein
MYAVCNVLQSEEEMQREHYLSLLVNYGKLRLGQYNRPRYYLCKITEQIQKPCCAVPWDTEKTIMNEKRWLFLHTRDSWYDILLDHLEEQLLDNKDDEPTIEPLPNGKKRVDQRREILHH